jgi:polyisoprenoid-binding protein YceI
MNIMKRERFTMCAVRVPLTFSFLLASVLLPSVTRAETPVFVITPENSSISFFVQASVSLKGTFDKWDSTLTVTSTDVTTAVLTVKIQADSVNTGSGMKDGKLKSKDFFNVEQDPLITFVSKKLEQTGPNTFVFTGDFTIRGVTKTALLTFILEGRRGSGSGTIKGTMSFNRKDFGMNKGIPFVNISDHVDVIVNLKVKKTSGPPMVFKQ